MKNYLIILIFVFTLCGCQSTFGPRALQYTHPAYNQVIVNTLDQQMLLNLVRLKYRDSPFFLNINSVTASFSMGADIGVGADLAVDVDQDSVRLGDGRVIKPNIGMRYSQNPTISYTPLQGEEFLKNILTPIPLEAILILAQSGWRIDRIFAICVERINSLKNAPKASGPTPPDEPQYKGFKRMLELLHQLHIAGLIEIGSDLGLDKSIKVKVLLGTDPGYQSELEELKSLLGVAQQPNLFNISTNFLHPKENELVIRTRSIASVLSYLSHNVEVPERHKEDGLVTITRTRDGKEFNWDETPAGTMFKVRSRKRGKPDNAFISVPYRGAWFYIVDNDLKSKSTFKLLGSLFSLQAGQIKIAGPTLTLPVGR
jgi:hypothetical protein